MTDWISNSLPGDVRSRTVNRLEHRRILLLRINITARSQTKATHYRPAKIAQNIADEIGSHDYIKSFRVQHEIRRGIIYIHLLVFYIRIIGAYLLDNPIPVSQAVNQCIGLRHVRYALSAIARQLK